MTHLRLDSAGSTYLLDLSGNGLPRAAYWGSRLDEEASPAALACCHRPPVFQAGLDTPYHLNLFPELGTGFKGRPALIGEKKRKNWASLFCINTVKHEKNAVKIILTDTLAALELVLDIRLDPETDLLCRRSTLKNLSPDPYNLHYCAAAAIEIPAFCRELLSFHGCWTGEFLTQRSDFSTGMALFENRTGRTSHEVFPGLIAGTAGFSENCGTVFGTHLAWSGNSSFFAEVVPDGSRQIQMGELLTPGEMVLETGQTYTTPWVYAAFSHTGLNGLSHKFHSFLRRSILPETIRSKKRPVVFNSWEAVYFAHDLDQLKEMASKASSLGFERFVLDDGWFHGRDDDSRALGDWQTDPEKYPRGLGPLIDHVKENGMDFGLWVEPEMVNPDSMLYRQHPDWVMGLAGFHHITGRNQLVLNLCRNEVADYLFDRLNDLLSSHDIDYLKWDMNRILTLAGHMGFPAFHQQTRALYGLIDRVKTAHPRVEIETCASGGARIDFEILKRTDRFWTSDSNDPFRRQVIQKGASLFFPPEAAGSHIGPAVCHTSGRVTDLKFRALTSFFNHFGAEFNLLELHSDQEEELAGFIELHKKYRDLLHRGKSVRLDLCDALRNGYGTVADDQTLALFCIVQMDIPAQTSDRTVRFSHLAPDGLYRVRLLRPVDPSIHSKLSFPEKWMKGFTLPGRVLMESGLSVFMPWPGTGVLFELKQVNPI